MAESSLQKSLNTRIGLQVSLSALPDLIEEWMDTEIDRWLESVPLPPELPAGESATFVVTLGSEASRLRWAAYGDPAGFVPKMGTYFDKVGIGKADVALLNQIGNSLEPRKVGSWVSVRDKAVRTGWQFLDRHPFAAIEPLFGQHAARDRLVAWLADAGVAEFQRFSQGVGGEPHTEIEWVLPGDTVATQLEAARAGFTELAGEALPDYAATAAAGVEPGLSLVVRIAGGAVVKVALRLPNPGEDVAASLCRDAGAGYDERVSQLVKALHADGLDAVEVIRTGGRTLIDVDFIPGTAPGDQPRKDVN
jgi:hypothetical protein